MLTGIFQPLLLVLLAVAAAPTNNDGIIGLAYDIAPACEDCGVVAESDGTAVAYDIVRACDDCGVVADGDGTALALDIVPGCADCGVVANGDGTAIALDIVPACDDCGVVADSDGTAITVAPTEWCCNMLYIGAERTTEKAAKSPVKSDRENLGMSPPWKGIALQFQKQPWEFIWSGFSRDTDKHRILKTSSERDPRILRIRVRPSPRTIMIIAHNLANDAMHRSADLVGIPSLCRQLITALRIFPPLLLAISAAPESSGEKFGFCWQKGPGFGRTRPSVLKEVYKTHPMSTQLDANEIIESAK
ncbi:hypothetical protein B0H13DRAFT_1866679 [Mycena leptocephala]|nr:hypothetical protein B0H13DRAFT_1866679 [Mycena leptocephala]